MAKTVVSPTNRVQKVITGLLAIIRSIPVAYLVAITIAEVIPFFFNELWGIIGHIIILAMTILHASLASEQPRQRLFLSLALVPLVRIISRSMPLLGIPFIWQFPIIYGPLAVTVVVLMRAVGYRAADVGLNFNRLPIQLVVALTGVVFGVVEYFILTEEAGEAYLLLGETPLLAGFILLVCTGFVEELIFRGVLQRSAVAMWGWWGIIYVSLLFASVHMIHGSAIDIAFVFVIAVFFAWVVKRTGSLLGVTLSHGITNIVLYLVAPLLL